MTSTQTNTCPFKVGDRIQELRCLPAYSDDDGETWVGGGFEPDQTRGVATVTEITSRGFKYCYEKSPPFVPRCGLSFTGEGEVFCDMGSPRMWVKADDNA